MAKRRVNTRFVLILSAVLAAVVVVGVIMVVRRSLNSDPVRLQEKGREALAANDLDQAIYYYKAAASAALRRHQPDAARVLSDLAKLYYDHSAGHSDFYGLAIRVWKQALIQDPSYLPAQEQVTEGTYLLAPTGSVTWKNVEDETNKLLKLKPGDGALYSNLGEAIIRQSPATGLGDDRRLLAREALNHAIALAPTDPHPVSLLAEMDLADAGVLERRGMLEQSQKLQDQAQTAMEAFCQKYPKSAAGLIDLARIHVVRWQAALADARAAGDAATQKLALDAAQKHAAAVESTLADAQRVEPGNAEVYSTLASFHMATDPPKAEADLRRAIQLDPTGLTEQMTLADYYRQRRRFDEAAALYRDVLKLRKSGIGVDSFRNDRVFGSNALRQLCRVEMDAAETAGASSEAGKAHLQQASALIEQIRGEQATDPVLSLLEGRLALIQGKLGDAVASLRAADSVLSTSVSPQYWAWLDTKWLLSQAFDKSGEQGLAIKYLDQIIEQFPTMTAARLRRAQLALRVARPNDALDDANAVLALLPKDETALRLKADALAHIPGREAEAQDIMRTLQSPDAVAQLGQMQLQDGQFQDALATVAPLLAKDPGFTPAIGVAVAAYSELSGQEKDAQKQAQLRAKAVALLDAALVKDPGNAQLKIVRTALSSVGLTDEQVQEKLLALLPSEFDRVMSQAAWAARKGELDKQLALLQKAEELRPESPLVVQQLFALALVRKDWELAQKCASRGERLNVDGVNGRLLQGQLQLAQNNLDAATKLLQDVVGERPENSSAHFWYAQALLAAGKTREARAEFQTVVDQRPNNVPALKALVQLYASSGQEGDLAAAARYVERARTFAPNDPEVQQFSDALLDPLKGIHDREDIRARRPDDVQNLRALARLYLMAARNEKAKTAPDQATVDDLSRKAQATLQDILGHDPKDIASASLVAQLDLQLGKPDDGLKLLQGYLTSDDAALRYAALLSLADFHALAGQPDASIQMLQEAVKQEPKGNTEAERQLGDRYFEYGRNPEAADVYRKLAEGDPNDLKLQRRLAETLVRSGEYAQAAGIMDKILAQHPDDQETLTLRGYALVRQNELDKAIAVFNQVLATNPDNPDALHFRAFATYLAQKNPQSAIDDLVKARSLRPGDANTRMLLARVYREAQDYTEAVAEYQAVIALRPDLPTPRQELAEFLFSLARSAVAIPSSRVDTFAVGLRTLRPIQRLQTLIDESIKRYPDQPTWEIMAGDLALLQGDEAGALAHHRKAYLASNKSGAAATAYLGSLLRARKYTEVMDETQRLLATAPNAPDLIVKRAQAQAGLKQPADALASFNHALDVTREQIGAALAVVAQMYATLPGNVVIDDLQARIVQDSADVAARLGVARGLLGRQQYAEGIAAIAPVTESKTPNVKAAALRIEALLYYQSGQFDKSRATYEQVLALQPDDIETLNNLAYLLADELKLPQEGLKYAERAVRVLRSRPVELAFISNGNVYDTYGWVKFLSGDVSGAEEELVRAVQAEPLPAAYLHLARVLKVEGRIADAKKQAAEAARLGQLAHDPIAAEARQFLAELDK